MTSTPHSTSSSRPSKPNSSASPLPRLPPSQHWEECLHRRRWERLWHTIHEHVRLNSSSSPKHGDGDDGAHGVQGQVWIGVYCVYAIYEKEGRRQDVPSDLWACEEGPAGSVGGVRGFCCVFSLFLGMEHYMTFFSTSSLLALMEYHSSDERKTLRAGSLSKVWNYMGTTSSSCCGMMACSSPTVRHSSPPALSMIFSHNFSFSLDTRPLFERVTTTFPPRRHGASTSTATSMLGRSLKNLLIRRYVLPSLSLQLRREPWSGSKSLVDSRGSKVDSRQP